MVQPLLAARESASDRSKKGPIGLVGCDSPGSLGSTSMWVMMDTAPEISCLQASLRARQMRLPNWPCVMAPSVNSGRAGTKSIEPSCWMARLPTCGPLPWTMTTFQPLRISERTDRAMASALAYCSSRVPRWSSRVSALPPRARTAVSAKAHSLSSGPIRPGGAGPGSSDLPIAEPTFL